MTDLKPITIGRSGRLELGDEVVALGFPLGLGGPTVTKGIVSGVDREIPRFAETAVSPNIWSGCCKRMLRSIRATLVVLFINSGGQLVGINTAAANAGSAENVGLRSLSIMLFLS